MTDHSMDRPGMPKRIWDTGQEQGVPFEFQLRMCIPGQIGKFIGTSIKHMDLKNKFIEFVVIYVFFFVFFVFLLCIYIVFKFCS